MAKLETETPIDLLHYEPPSAGGATKRQLVCIVIAVTAGLVPYFLLTFLAGIPGEYLSWWLAVTMLPCIAMGWVRPFNLRFEVFAKLLLEHLKQNPHKSAVKGRSHYHNEPFKRHEYENCRVYLYPSKREERRLRRELRRACKGAHRAVRTENRAWRKACRKAAKQAK